MAPTLSADRDGRGGSVRSAAGAKNAAAVPDHLAHRHFRLRSAGLYRISYPADRQPRACTGRSRLLLVCGPVRRVGRARILAATPPNSHTMASGGAIACGWGRRLLRARVRRVTMGRDECPWSDRSDAAAAGAGTLGMDDSVRARFENRAGIRMVH